MTPRDGFLGISARLFAVGALAMLEVSYGSRKRPSGNAGDDPQQRLDPSHNPRAGAAVVHVRTPINPGLAFGEMLLPMICG
jgi:hypothetical protein